MTRLVVPAPAKLNLTLAVGPPGAGGMHSICSWMVTIDLCDELVVTRLPSGRLSRYAITWHDDARRRTDIDWSITDDLAVRAHLALEAHVGRPLPVQLHLRKRIPVGGGLGGGSSAAAAMLRAVDTLFDLNVPSAEMMTIGSTLGSDVPFFVRGGSAIVEGRGEIVAPHDTVPALHVVVVFPDAMCPTGAVYRRFDETPARPLDAERVRAATVTDPSGDALFNDLAEAARHVSPAVGDALERVSEITARAAHVSGSGSSVFVLCDDAEQARHLAGQIEDTLGISAIPARSYLPPDGARD